MFRINSLLLTSFKLYLNVELKRKNVINALSLAGRNVSCITFNSSKHRHSSRVFALYHRRELRGVASYYSRSRRLATSSTMIFVSSTKNLTFPPRYLKYFKGSWHLSDRIALERAEMILRRFLKWN